MSKIGSADRIVSVSAVSSRDSGRHHEVRSGANTQREKIRQIGEALRQAGFVTLNGQARALGLARSTTWKLLQADHKTSGIHADLIIQMLSSEGLPLAVRCLLREYVIERVRGLYGHNLLCRRRFAGQLWDLPELAVDLQECKNQLWPKMAEMEGARSLPTPLGDPENSS
jgi:hypothetical protein